MNTQIFKHAAKLLVAGSICCLLGCGKPDTEKKFNIEVESSYSQQEILQIHTTFKKYFGTALTIQKISRGPSGTTKVELTTSNQLEIKTVYLLPDLQHVIDGVMYSPYMSAQEITSQHVVTAKQRAILNDELSSTKNRMRNAISEAITSGKTTEQIQDATKDAIAERVNGDAIAKKDFIGQVTGTVELETQKLETAQLPRNNSVIDTESIYKEIEKSNWISQGDGKKILYVFFDFRCHACREVHKLLDNLIATKSITVRFIPVGALGPESQHMAAVALASDHNNERLKTLKELIASNGKTLSNIPAVSADSMAKGQINALRNFKSLLLTKKVVTPTFAYKTLSGSTISVLTSEQQLNDVIERIIE